jgi:hypothetical protein
MVDRKLLAAALALAFAWIMPSSANAEVRRERTLRRPYIVEIGAPYSISMATLHTEAQKIVELKDYLTGYGYPDYVEIQEISPEWPWESYEVRLYYLRRNIEVDFGHVLTVDTPVPDFGVMKFQGGIPAQKRHEISVVSEAPDSPAPTPQPPAAPAPAPQESNLSTVVARIEAAAERAAQAADKAVEQSEAAERAANRTVTIVDKMLESTKPAAKHR